MSSVTQPPKRIALQVAWSLGLMLAIAMPFIRVNTSFQPQEFLWAEDGAVFLNGALHDGSKSIFAPYAGYLHVTQRLLALFAVQLDLYWAPAIFFTGWCLAALGLLVAIVRFLAQSGVRTELALVAYCLVFMQPHGGEIFYNVTNIQWLTGLMLAVVTLSDSNGIGKVASIGCVALATLTGPFSVILAPVLALRAWVERRIRVVDILVGAGALVQFLVFLHSPRGNAELADLRIAHWLSAVWTFATFGSQYFLIHVCGLVFWISVGRQIAADIRGARVRPVSGDRQVFLVLFGLGVFGASLWAVKAIPDVITPRSSGARYFFIPYAAGIVYFVAKQNSGGWPSYSKLVSLLVIFAAHFVSVDHEHRQFRAYQAVSAVDPGIEIPLTPKGWSFSIQSHPKSSNYVVRYSDKRADKTVHGGVAGRAILVRATQNCRPDEFVSISIGGRDLRANEYSVNAIDSAKSDYVLLRFDLTHNTNRVLLAYTQPRSSPPVSITNREFADLENTEITVRCIVRRA